MFARVPALLVVALLAGCSSGGDAADDVPVSLASDDEMFEWVEELWRIGDESEYGYRMPGSDADVEGTAYVFEKFEEIGLVDVFQEPVSIRTQFPSEWGLEVVSGETTTAISSHFLRYSKLTPEAGVTADMVYVGEGSAAEFDEAGDVAGKIVVVDATAAPTPVLFLSATYSVFEYDPAGTLEGDNAYENFPPRNLTPSFQEAAARGAVGLVAILTFTVDDNNQYLHWYDREGLIPGLSISPNDGDSLRSMLADGPVRATMTLTGTEGVGDSYNVYGTVPGRNYGTDQDEFIAVQSHHDGWATNDASGMAVVFALAQYYAQMPRESRRYSILFFGYGSHFGLLEEGEVGSFIGRKNPEHIYDLILADKVRFAAPIEMIGKQYKVVDRQYVETGLPAPRAFMTNPELPAAILQAAEEAIIEHDYDRSNIAVDFFNGEPKKWEDLVPTVGLISHNAPQFTSADTPDTVMKSDLSKTAAVYVDIIDAAQEAFEADASP